VNLVDCDGCDGRRKIFVVTMIWVYLHILGVNCMFKDIGLDVHLDWLRFGCLASDSLDLLLKRSASFYLGGGCVRVFLSIVSARGIYLLCV